MVPDAAVKHYKQMQRLQALAVLQAADLWSEVSLSSLDGSWGCAGAVVGSCAHERSG